MNDQQLLSEKHANYGRAESSSLKTEKVISKEDLFSNKKSLEIDTSNLDETPNYQFDALNSYNQQNMMQYYMNNPQFNNAQFVPQNTTFQYNNADYFKQNRVVQNKKPYNNNYNNNYNKQYYSQGNNNNNYINNRSQNNYSNQYTNYGQQAQSQANYNEVSLLESLKYASEKYPQLVKINTLNSGIVNSVIEQKNPRFFVIKSFTEEDIHKAIKYNCWSSTKEGNKKLNNAYHECLQAESDLFLFFSMNGSGRFVGVARMRSEVDEQMIFEYWAMDDVWKGLFQIEWVMIKDIPNKFLKDIKLSNNGYKPVTNSRDTQEIPRNEGQTFLQIFEEFSNATSILQHFQYYDERQELFEKTRVQN